MYNFLLHFLYTMSKYLYRLMVLNPKGHTLNFTSFSYLVSFLPPVLLQ